MTHKLKIDYYSKGKDHKLYGIKGDLVQMIHYGSAASIVENSLGDRFAISTDLLEPINKPE